MHTLGSRGSLLLLFAFLVGCGGASEPPAMAPAPPPAAEPTAGGEEAVAEEAVEEEAAEEEAAEQEAVAEEAAEDPVPDELAAEATPAPIVVVRGAEAETHAAPKAAPRAKARRPVQPAPTASAAPSAAAAAEPAAMAEPEPEPRPAAAADAAAADAAAADAAAAAAADAAADAAPRDAMDWFDDLPDSAIQYNRPERVPFGGSFEIGLVIDITGDQQAAGAALDALRAGNPEMVGETRAVAAPTGDEVEVTLLGSNAIIEPLEPARQRISRRQPARWRWNITPAGPHDVELNLSVLAIEPGRAAGMKIESYTDTIRVEVTTAQRAQLWLADNWEWAWTFLGAPVLAFGWGFVQKRRKQQGDAAA